MYYSSPVLQQDSFLDETSVTSLFPISRVVGMVTTGLTGGYRHHTL